MNAMANQRSQLIVGGYYTNGSELRQLVAVGTWTLTTEDAATGESHEHGIGGFRRNWWLVRS